jgi:hypothetical protein
MNPIVENNFMNKKDCDLIINFIENNLEMFGTGKYKLAHRLLFGVDYWHKESIKKISGIDPILPTVKEYFVKIIDNIKDKYNLDGQYYIASFWLTRQIEGAFLDLHSDTDVDQNTQLEYSCGIYLNDVMLDGILEFPEINYNYQPRMGDLVSWKSSGREYDHQVSKITDTRYAMLVWLTSDPSYSLIDL